MKRILYYNNIAIESMYSQFMDGIPQRTTSETNDYTESNERIESPSTEITGGVGLSFGNFAIHRTPLSNTSEKRRYLLSRDSVERLVSDNALNDIIKCMTDKNELNNSQYTKYINVTANFDFYDIENIRRLISAPEHKQQYKRSLQNINFLDSILPYKHFALNNEYIIPLNKRYFRTAFQNIRLNYSDGVTVMGVKGAVISDALKYKNSSLLDGFNESVDDIVNEVFGKNGITLIDPIAIYL